MADNFYIVDANKLLNQAGSLVQMNTNIIRLKEQLSNYSNQISNAWQSETEDKESVLKSLNEDLKRIDTLNSALNSLSKKLSYFAQKSINESKK